MNYSWIHTPSVVVTDTQAYYYIDAKKVYKSAKRRAKNLDLLFLTVLDKAQFPTISDCYRVQTECIAYSLIHLVVAEFWASEPCILQFF